MNDTSLFCIHGYAKSACWECGEPELSEPQGEPILNPPPIGKKGPPDGQRWYCPETGIWIQWSAPNRRWIVLGPASYQKSQDAPTIAPPESIRIGHLTIAIHPGVPKPADQFGWMDYDTCTIHYCKELPPALLADTILHEVIHAIFFAFGIPNRKLKEEQIALTLAGPLLMVARDNPALVAWLAALLRG